MNHTNALSFFILHFLRKFLCRRAQVCWHTLLSFLIISSCSSTEKTKSILHSNRLCKKKGKKKKKKQLKQSSWTHSPRCPGWRPRLALLLTHMQFFKEYKVVTNVKCPASWPFSEGSMVMNEVRAVVWELFSFLSQKQIFLPHPDFATI